LRTTILIIVFCGSISLLSGQNNRLTRHPYTLKLFLDNQRIYEVDIQGSKFVLPDNSIQLYSGESVFIEVELVDSSIVSIKSVEKNINPERTIELSLRQNTENFNHLNSIFRIFNPLSRSIIYEAKIFVSGKSNWVETEVIPVKPMKASFEIWPEVVISIAILNITL
tara:strand:- start:134 stop:634 length:501 start_codon:yes stop_codon:yes gene_type:complete